MSRSVRRRRDADDADEEGDVFEGGGGFLDDDDEDEVLKTADTKQVSDNSSAAKNSDSAVNTPAKSGAAVNSDSAVNSKKTEVKCVSKTEVYAAKQTDQPEPTAEQQQIEEIGSNRDEGSRLHAEPDEGEARGHPTFVPRNDRYFWHEDRGGGGEPLSDGEGRERKFRLRADEVAEVADRELVHRRELIDTEITNDDGSPTSKWLHDRFDSVGEPPVRRGRGGFRGYRGGGGRDFRGNRGGRGFNRNQHDGFRYRFHDDRNQHERNGFDLTNRENNPKGEYRDSRFEGRRGGRGRSYNE